MLLTGLPIIQALLTWTSWLSGSSNIVTRSYAYVSYPLALERLFDNVATRDFNGQGAYYPSYLLPQRSLKIDNVDFSLPSWGNARPDNVMANGQLIPVNISYVREFHLLYAGDWIDGETGANFTFQFEDGSEQSVVCSVKNWWTLHWLNSGPIQIPYHETPNGRNHNLTQMYHWTTSVSTISALRGIKLPEISAYNRLHIFAISLVPAVPPKPEGYYEPALAIKNVRSTPRFVEDGPSKGDPIVEVTFANLHAHWIDYRNLFTYLFENYTVHLIGSKIVTTVPGRIRRLMPGDDFRLDVAIQDKSVLLGGYHTIEVELRQRDYPIWRSGEWPLIAMDPEYDASRESLSRHETPRWWRDSKFGIFIHWGIYSVPGWAPIGYYEEWYHWWLHNPAQPSNFLWRYHRDTYGENVVYDDFIADFSGAKFNASSWVDLFANAGARYFVLVTKHHDGFALFDTANTTHRSSVYLGPQRDFLDELMIAAKDRHPELKRGTYYSMPEWFNPAFADYGFGNWPGGLAKNAYNSSKLEPYTGHLEGKDYLEDIQQEHMQLLAERYDTDIMWCDIGGPNRSTEFAAKWYNDARKVGRQVTMNNRCGVGPDFDTPEYARFSSVQTRSWETNEGIDPYSYGYNRQTKDEDYRSARDIIHSLVDIVSKNGNYLLNIGPTGDGEIIPAMVERLLEVGKWLGHSGPCIYNTIYWFGGAEEGALRFTSTTDTFCIISLERPPPSHPDETAAILAAFESHQSNRYRAHAYQGESFAVLTVDRPIPFLPSDRVFLLGGGGRDLPWAYDGESPRLKFLVPEDELDRIKHAWALEIRYFSA